ncbi:MAG: glycosyltransferase family 4 protein [Anaerolineae bacterium]|nr:glycosyltransferase family 4 protein [Anaerolineae bacterium]
MRTNGRKLELHIYGNTEQFTVYTQQCKDLAGDDTRITFHGRFENSRVVEVLRSFDVSVVPSTWYENAPLAILESRATGVPVITSRLGGMAELVQHELDGLHFTPEDSGDLARQFQRLLDEPELLLRLKAGTRQRVPRSIEDEMAQLMGLYENLAKTGSRTL